MKIKNSTILSSELSNEETKPVNVSPNVNVTDKLFESESRIDRTLDSSQFLRENLLVPVYINEESDPDNGRLILCYYKYRLPFPTFSTIEESAEYVMSHPVLVTLAVVSCIETLKTENHEQLS